MKQFRDTNYRVDEYGHVFNIRKGKPLKWIIGRGNYARVVIHGQWFFVHRLVAEIYIPNPKNKPFVNHKDGNKQNCHKDNLEWATREENEQHAIDNGLKFRASGIINGMAKLSEREIKAIRKLLNKGVKQRIIAEKFNVSRGHISGIKHKFWKHI